MPRALHQRKEDREGSEKEGDGQSENFLIECEENSRRANRLLARVNEALTKGYVLFTAEMMPFFVENEAHYGDQNKS